MHIVSFIPVLQGSGMQIPLTNSHWPFCKVSEVLGTYKCDPPSTSGSFPQGTKVTIVAETFLGESAKSQLRLSKPSNK